MNILIKQKKTFLSFLVTSIFTYGFGVLGSFAQVGVVPKEDCERKCTSKLDYVKKECNITGYYKLALVPNVKNIPWQDHDNPTGQIYLFSPQPYVTNEFVSDDAWVLSGKCHVSNKGKICIGYRPIDQFGKNSGIGKCTTANLELPCFVRKGTELYYGKTVDPQNFCQCCLDPNVIKKFPQHLQDKEPWKSCLNPPQDQ